MAKGFFGKHTQETKDKIRATKCEECRKKTDNYKGRGLKKLNNK